MNVTVLRAAQLTADLAQVWAEIQHARPDLCSPYFRPEFTQAVAAVRGDAEVAVAWEGGQPVAFFPFHRLRNDWGIPIGGCMSDYQGLISREGLAVDPSELIAASGLKAWDFDHVPAAQSGFLPFHAGHASSPYIRLAGVEGDPVLRDRTSKSTESSARKIAREVGPLRLEIDCSSDEVFRVLVDWKRDQYRRTRVLDVLSLGWTLDLLETLRGCRGPGLSGMLSALYAGDRLVAAHFGMRSQDVLHYWFPTYDPALGRYSPGRVLLLELVKAGGSAGIRQIDLGKGDSQFKRSFMSGQTPLLEGVVDFRPVRRRLRHAWGSALGWARRSALRRPGRWVLSALRPVVMRIVMRRELSRSPG